MKLNSPVSVLFIVGVDSTGDWLLSLNDLCRVIQVEGATQMLGWEMYGDNTGGDWTLMALECPVVGSSFQLQQSGNTLTTCGKNDQFPGEGPPVYRARPLNLLH